MLLNKRTLMFISGGILLTAGVIACNHGMHYGSAEERGEWMVQKVSKELQLNETQQARLVEVKDEFLDLRMKLRGDRAQIQTDVLTMLQQPTLDRNKANAILDQQITKISTHSPIVIDAIGNFYDSLDDEQRVELRGFIEHKMNHHHGHHYWH